MYNRKKLWGSCAPTNPDRGRIRSAAEVPAAYATRPEHDKYSRSAIDSVAWCPYFPLLAFASTRRTEVIKDVENVNTIVRAESFVYRKSMNF